MEPRKTSSTGKILVVEDEETILGIVSRALTASGYEVETATDGVSALERANSEVLSAIVLDLMLPDVDGLDLIPRLKSVTDAPMIALTARGDWQDRVRGLEAGADDYMGKPFQVEELVARVKALVRRSAHRSRIVEIADLKIDLESRRVTLRGKKLFFSTTEFQVLEVLAERVGQIVSREEILEKVWEDPERDSNVVEVYINYLRQKLQSQGSRYISNIRGKGYVLNPEIE